LSTFLSGWFTKRSGAAKQLLAIGNSFFVSLLPLRFQPATIPFTGSTTLWGIASYVRLLGWEPKVDWVDASFGLKSLSVLKIPFREVSPIFTFGLSLPLQC
jgi:hypothetical protein